jgi:hypothetical protein
LSGANSLGSLTANLHDPKLWYLIASLFLIFVRRGIQLIQQRTRSLFQIQTHLSVWPDLSVTTLAHGAYLSGINVLIAAIVLSATHVSIGSISQLIVLKEPKRDWAVSLNQSCWITSSKTSAMLHLHFHGSRIWGFFNYIFLNKYYLQKYTSKINIYKTIHLSLGPWTTGPHGLPACRPGI